MAASAPTHEDGFTMDFSLDVFSDIEQDVEDVARQVALGNFRKARRMYEEALSLHRNIFPIYAEFLRLCLDSGDWNSLAEASSDLGFGRWSALASDLVYLLRAVESIRQYKHRTYDMFREHNSLVISSALRLGKQLGSMSFQDFDIEQSFAAVILLSMRYWESVEDALSMDLAAQEEISPVYDLPASEICTFTEHLLRQNQYWAAEKALEVLFHKNLGNSREYTSSYDQVQEAWNSIQWFVKDSRLQDEEQELWAKIAILQTFCEGLQRTFLVRPVEARDWCFSKSIPILTNLVEQALSRDETGEWSRSRSSIRYRLLVIDKGVADAAERGDIVWRVLMSETLFRLCHDADTNQDPKMESTVHHRIRALRLGYGFAGWFSGEGDEWWPGKIEQGEPSHKGMRADEQGFVGSVASKKKMYTSVRRGWEM